MARHFNGTSQWYWSHSAANVAGLVGAQAPMTAMAWFNPETTVQDGTLLVLGTSGSTNSSNRLIFNAAGFEISCSARNGAGTENFATTSGAGTAGQAAGIWGCAVGVWVSATDRRAFYGRPGISPIKGTSATNVAWGAPDVLTVGARPNASGVFYKGHIAHVCIWRVALTDSEVAPLTQGANPLTIQQNQILCYYPLDNGANGLEFQRDSARGRVPLLPTSLNGGVGPTVPASGPTGQLVADPPVQPFLVPFLGSKQ